MKSSNVMSFLLSILLVQSCSSSYMPRNSGGRISTIWKGGSAAYLRDGRTYKAGVFGSGLVDVVDGVPEAEAAARVSRRRGITGLLLTVGGAVCASIALAAYTDQAGDLPSEGAAVTGACFLSVAAGFGFSLSGISHRYDAINIFNDSVPDGPIKLPPGVSIKHQ